MTTHLYLSPHFDDVVFSCAGKILQDIEQGINVVVVTVFCQTNDKNEMKVRALENKSALNKLGVMDTYIINLSEQDAPFRHDFYNSFERIVLDTHPNDSNPQFITHLETVFTNLVDNLNVDTVYSPLSVGTHIDHRLCFQAVRNCNFSNVRYFEDRPYSLAHFSVEARLIQIGYPPQNLADFSVEGYLKGLSDMRYVEQYLPVGELRQKYFDSVTNQLETALSTVKKGGITKESTITSYLFDQSQFKKISQAVSCYETQINDFFGSQALFENAYENYALNHNRDGNNAPAHIERYHTLK
jgi:LmbE family N-acetylglucosaminyl deacetylase